MFSWMELNIMVLDAVYVWIMKEKKSVLEVGRLVVCTISLGRSGAWHFCYLPT